MKKITDRFWLGIISGLGGNIAKMAIEEFFRRRGAIESTSIKKASAVFVRKVDVDTPHGKLVGVAADNMIAAALGVSCAYWLTLMGKDKYAIKGAFLGALEWTAIYGALSRFGATAIFPVKPLEALIGFLSHFTFGAIKMSIVANLGDSRLFQPKDLALKLEEPEELF